MTTKQLVAEFNAKYPTSVVYLKLHDESESRSLPAFQIHFRFQDRFVEHSIYDRGNAIIYPSEALYEEIQKLAGDQKVTWNNTQSIGWIY